MSSDVTEAQLQVKYQALQMDLRKQQRDFEVASRSLSASQKSWQTIHDRVLTSQKKLFAEVKKTGFSAREKIERADYLTRKISTEKKQLTQAGSQLKKAENNYSNCGAKVLSSNRRIELVDERKREIRSHKLESSFERDIAETSEVRAVAQLRADMGDEKNLKSVADTQTYQDPGYQQSNMQNDGSKSGSNQDNGNCGTNSNTAQNDAGTGKTIAGSSDAAVELLAMSFGKRELVLTPGYSRTGARELSMSYRREGTPVELTLSEVGQGGVGVSINCGGNISQTELQSIKRKTMDAIRKSGVVVSDLNARKRKEE